MPEIPVEEAAANLSQLVEAAARGEAVYITDAHQHRVRLIAAPRAAGRRRAGSARGQVTMASDFDAPLDDFREYVP